MSRGSGGTSGGKLPFVAVKLNDSVMDRSIKSITIEDHDRLIDKAVLEVWDREGMCTDFVQENNTVAIDLGWATEHATLFIGFVRKIEFERNPAARRLVTITAYDPSYRMMTHEDRGARDHTGKLSQIIRNVVTPYTDIVIDKIEPDPDEEFTESRPLRQDAGKKDWQFLQDLTLAMGGRTFVEYNDDQAKFYFLSEGALMAQEPTGQLNLCRGFSHVREFNVERVAAWAAMRRNAVTVNPGTGEVTVTETPPAPAPSGPTPPDANQEARLTREYGSAAAARYVAAAEIGAAAPSTRETLTPAGTARGLPSDPRMAAWLSRTDPTRISGYRGTGVANGTIHLRAKGKITLDGISQWADGDWYVNKAVHKYVKTSSSREDRGHYTTEFVVTR